SADRATPCSSFASTPQLAATLGTEWAQSAPGDEHPGKWCVTAGLGAPPPPHLSLAVGSRPVPTTIPATRDQGETGLCMMRATEALASPVGRHSSTAPPLHRTLLFSPRWCYSPLPTHHLTCFFSLRIPWEEPLSWSPRRDRAYTPRKDMGQEVRPRKHAGTRNPTSTPASSSWKRCA